MNNSFLESTVMNTHFIKWREKKDNDFSMVIAGDFCPWEKNCNDLIERVDEITSQIKPFFDSADLKVLQWECAVTRQDTPIDKSGPNLRCYPECSVFATSLGIDTVLLANNHIGDYGAGGIQDTIDIFKKLNIRTVGAGMNAAEAARPLHIRQNGLTVSIINAAEYEFGVAYGDVPGSYVIDPLRLAADVRREKAECDLVVVALHGGHEMYSYPTLRLRELCRSMVDYGADAVFNCHTHCPLGYEVYNDAPIIYCPGNFYFPGNSRDIPCWFIGYLPKFFFDEDGAFALELLPYYNYQKAVTLMDDAETEKFFAYLDELAAPINDDARLQKLFDAWCAKGVIKGYFGNLFNRPIPESFNERDGVKRNLDLRNLFTCQSHCDLLCNTLLLMERYQLEEAKELIPFIDAAQFPQWAKICL